jgi:hypothetical protein
MNDKTKIIVVQIVLGIFLVLLLTAGQIIANMLEMKTAGESLDFCISIERK